MEIAYIRLAHKYHKQLMRFITRLDSGKTSFLLHIDKKTMVFSIAERTQISSIS